jgi:hypothetical protein
VKTTLDLPDELMRTIKHRAVREDRTLKDLIAELLLRGLADETPIRSDARRRVLFPLIVSKHTAIPEEEMTPERVAEILLDGDVSRLG